MRKNLLLIAALLGSLFAANKALAICPVCTIAVCAGLGLSRWLGINDAVTGLWIGGLLVSVSVWTVTWLNSKRIDFPWRSVIVTFAYYVLALLPLYFTKIIAHPVDFLSSCVKDNLLLGIVQGSAAFSFAAMLYDYLKEKNGGKAHFPFEKVVFPVGSLIIFTVIFYFLTK